MNQKLIIPLSVCLGFLISCSGSLPTEPNLHDFWSNRVIENKNINALYQASSYLSVYSEIYSNNEKTTHNLTVTLSMRNTSSIDTVFILSANYFNTEGHLIKSYFDHPIYILPLETAELVVTEKGGTGGNFIFDWATENSKLEPIFEAVMISTSGQQGISFVTQGIKRTSE
ncbi:DUF3124 domain-containing protein [Crocinitomix catalasitica]|uniref:DUF3124 domain-containing protein n=1 Tax=Crocinitomix catalasitica TaxID=184607 RepID=UPI0004897659|nr:DUF3124 domain-containing protein [Crocinitomix catalasitica]